MAGFLDYLKKKGSMADDTELVGASSSKPMTEMQVPALPTANSYMPEELEGVEANYSLADTQPQAEVETPYSQKELEKLLAAQGFYPSTPDETPEEKAKREKRDAIRVGWTGFLDGLNALSNLYYTTQWAPNQKQGNALAPVMADIKEKEKLRRAQDIERSKEYKAYKDNVDKMISNWMLEAAKYKAEQAAADVAHGRKLEEIRERNDNATFMEGLRHGNRVALAQARDAAAMARTQVREDNINNRANSRGGGRSSSKNSIRLSDGSVHDYSKDKAGALESVFEKMKRAIEKSDDEELKANLYDIRNAKTQTQKLSYLNEYAQYFPEFDDEIRKIIGAKVDDVIDYDSDDEEIIDY